ncbi:hypothetical protein O181_035052 [Austropuccinia psidii MF-1]|uniref:Uncharacterized protein n=1 Tax=Austropuccinia psidii MF-1 TaxID=1389203 RepID=A0A9Q3D4G5_9BASI|nr:hypothetical protein [Austropuccinia psidii MF-1]
MDRLACIDSSQYQKEPIQRFKQPILSCGMILGWRAEQSSGIGLALPPFRRHELRNGARRGVAMPTFVSKANPLVFCMPRRLPATRGTDSARSAEMP